MASEQIAHAQSDAGQEEAHASDQTYVRVALILAVITGDSPTLHKAG